MLVRRPNAVRSDVRRHGGVNDADECSTRIHAQLSAPPKPPIFHRAGRTTTGRIALHIIISLLFVKPENHGALLSSPSSLWPLVHGPVGITAKSFPRPPINQSSSNNILRVEYSSCTCALQSVVFMLSSIPVEPHAHLATHSYEAALGSPRLGGTT